MDFKIIESRKKGEAWTCLILGPRGEDWGLEDILVKMQPVSDKSTHYKLNELGQKPGFKRDGGSEAHFQLENTMHPKIKKLRIWYYGGPDNGMSSMVKKYIEAIEKRDQKPDNTD